MEDMVLLSADNGSKINELIASKVSCVRGRGAVL